MINFKQKKILVVSPNNLGDGSDYVLEEIVLECSKRFKKIEVIYFRQLNGKGWKNLPDNVSVNCLNAKNYWSAIFLLALFLKKSFSNQQFYFCLSSNVHINASLGFFRFLKVFKTENLVARESTLIFERFSFLKKMNYRLRYLIGYSFVDLVICQTHNMQKSLTNSISFLKKKCVIISNPLNTEKVEKGANEAVEGLQQHSPYILSVSRLIPVKQLSMLIDAYNLLPTKKMKLLIVGDGIEKSALQKKINDLKLSEKVILWGYSNNPYPIMKAASICVLSSKHEGFPNSLLQMLWLNDNCISTNCSDILQEIPALKLVKNDSPIELSKAIENMMNGELSDKTQLIERKVFLQKLSVENFVNSLLKNLADSK